MKTSGRANPERQRGHTTCAPVLHVGVGRAGPAPRLLGAFHSAAKNSLETWLCVEACMLLACLVGLDWASCSTEHCQALWATQGEAGGCFVPEPQLLKTRPISRTAPAPSVRPALPASGKGGCSSEFTWGNGSSCLQEPRCRGPH